MILRELVVKIGTKFDGSGIVEAEKGVDSLKDKFEGLLAGFSAGAIAHGITSLVEGAIHLSSRLSDTAAQFGVGTDALQRFQYAALVTGVKTEQFNAALGPLSRQIFAAGEGSKEAAALFHKFGIAFKDSRGEILPTEEVIGNIADQVSKLKSPAEQAGLAMKFFGRSGAKLVPILRGGRAGLRAAGLALDHLGGPVASTAIESMATLGDNIDAVHTALEDMRVEIAYALEPIISRVVETIGTLVGQFRDVVRNSRIAQAAFITLTGLMAFFAVRALIAFGPVILTIAAVVAGLVALTLLFDELYVTLEGGDSILNRFVQWAMDSTKEATGLLGVIKEIGKTIFSLGDKVYDFLHPFEQGQGTGTTRTNGGVAAQYTSADGSTLTDENGQKLERKQTDGFLGFGKKTYYVPAGAGGTGSTNDLAPMGVGGEGNYNTLGPGNTNDLAPMNRGAAGGGFGTISNDVQITVIPSAGMSAADVGVEVKKQFDTHLSKAVKSARAANLPAVPRGGQ